MKRLGSASSFPHHPQHLARREEGEDDGGGDEGQDHAGYQLVVEILRQHVELLGGGDPRAEQV